MRSWWHMALAGAGILALGLGFTARATAQVPVLAGSCTPAALASVSLPAPVTIDEVRVVVAGHSPRTGAVDVRVGAGAFDRIVRVRGASSRALSFYPAMTAATFEVALDPVFDAPQDACVERIELRRGGVAVAVYRP